MTDGLRDWWRRRTAAHALRHQGDRMLEDMGIAREAIRDRLRGGAGGDAAPEAAPRQAARPHAPLALWPLVR